MVAAVGRVVDVRGGGLGSVGVRVITVGRAAIGVVGVLVVLLLLVLSSGQLRAAVAAVVGRRRLALQANQDC